MKLLNILLISLLILGSGICQTNRMKAQKEKESISSQYNIMSGADIKAMVQVQIDSAKARNFRGVIKSCAYHANSFQGQTYSNENSNKEFSNIESKPVIEINAEVFVFVIFSISVFLFVSVRRFLNKRKFSASTPGPESITIDKKKDTGGNEADDLEELRNRLNPNIKESSLPSKTNGMKIAQGEMILAAKIKSYQLELFDNK